MRFTEGRAWLSKCSVVSCEEPIIEAHVDGMKLRLSTKSVPLKDALILQKYRIVVNIWKGPTQLWAVGWHRDQKTVDKGRLYCQHICGAHP